MIIYMFRDNQHITTGGYLADLYYPPNSNMSNLLNPDCFAIANLPDRITFLGHAGPTHFGSGRNEITSRITYGYKPVEFVDYLIDTCHLPQSVKVIDLLGCEIGFIKDGKNYVSEVAKRFTERGYSLRINAFTNLNYGGIPLAGMILSTNNFGEVRISGWTQNNQFELDRLRKEEILILTDKKSIKFKMAEIQNNITDLQSHKLDLQKIISKNSNQLISMKIQLQRQNELLIQADKKIQYLLEEKNDALGINRKNPFFRDIETIDNELTKAREAYGQQRKICEELFSTTSKLDIETRNTTHVLQHDLPKREQELRMDLIKLQQQSVAIDSALEVNKKSINAIYNQVVLLQTIDYRNALDAFPNQFQFVSGNAQRVSEPIKTALPNGHPYFVKKNRWGFVSEPDRLVSVQVHHMNLDNRDPHNPVFLHVAGLENFNESFTFRNEKIDALIEAHLLTDSQADALSTQEVENLSRPEITDLVLEGELDINLAKKLDEAQAKQLTDHFSDTTIDQIQHDISLKENSKRFSEINETHDSPQKTEVLPEEPSANQGKH